MFDRLGPLLLISAHNTQIVLGDRRLGVYGKDMGPKSLRVVPDLDLVPGENAQPDDDTDGTAGNEETLGAPAREQASAGQERPSEACQVGVAIRGNLRAALKDPEHRQEDHDVRHPRRRQTRQSTTEANARAMMATTTP